MRYREHVRVLAGDLFQPMRQAREMRGKAEPRGATPAKDNAGTVAKAQALRDALDRVEAELGRRDAAAT